MMANTPPGQSADNPVDNQRDFGSLPLRRNHHYQLLWVANLFFFTGAALQTLVLSWLAYQTTHSALGLAIFTAVRIVPSLFGVFAGTFADRISRTRLLILAAAWAGAAALIIAAIVRTGSMPLAGLVLAGFILALAESPSQPARASLLFNLVGLRKLNTANSLNALTYGLAQIIGPALGGVMIAGLNAAAAMVAAATAYLLSILALLPLRADARPVSAASESVRAMIFSGLKTARNSQIVLGTLLVTLAANLFIFPVFNAFMPVFSAELDLGADGLGYLVGCYNVGGLVGSLVLAGLGDFRFKNLVFWIGTILWGLAWTGFAAASWNLTLSFTVVFLAGGFGAVFGSLRTTLLLASTDPACHGRITGLVEVLIGTMPLSLPILGVIADLIGAATTTAGASILFVAAAICVGVALPRFRSVSPVSRPRRDGR